MTVAELITELQKYPPNAVVLKESLLGTFYMNLGSPATGMQVVCQTDLNPGNHKGGFVKATTFSHRNLPAVIIKR